MGIGRISWVSETKSQNVLEGALRGHLAQTPGSGRVTWTRLPRAVSKVLLNIPEHGGSTAPTAGAPSQWKRDPWCAQGAPHGSLCALLCWFCHWASLKGAFCFMKTLKALSSMAQKSSSLAYELPFSLSSCASWCGNFLNCKKSMGSGYA